jgi:membrane protein required for colicin V production
MTIFDYVVLLIVGLSILLSVMRGAVREILALASWVAAFLVANTYGVWLAGHLPAAIPGEPLKLLAAFVILFLTMLLLMSLFTIALSELIKTIGLGTFDRGLGAIFGFARGLLIVMVLVILSGLTSLPLQQFWRDAMFSAPLEVVTMKAKVWLPDDFAKRLSYD